MVCNGYVAGRIAASRGLATFSNLEMQHSPKIFCIFLQKVLAKNSEMLCKTEKIKNLFVSPATDATEVIHSQISYHSFNQEYFTAISCCVDKYSEKLKKLIVFSAFQSVYPLVRMTDSFSIGFAFSFGLRYNSPSKTKERRT